MYTHVCMQDSHTYAVLHTIYTTLGSSLHTPTQSYILFPSDPSAKVRRLYDIANVLVSMGLIAKDSYINTSGGYHKPGFYWVGPDITDVSHIRELGGNCNVVHVHTHD